MGSGFETLEDAVAGAVDGLGGQAAFSVVAWGLALVFVMSAVPKLRKPELAAMAMVDFGVLEKPRAAAGTALGVVEVAIALALAVAAAGGSAALRTVPMTAAALTLWAFVVLILRALRSPERFECFCFGEGGEISGRTLARTGALASVATAFAIAAPGIPAGAPGTDTLFLTLMVSVSILGVAAVLSTLPAIREVTS